MDSLDGFVVELGRATHVPQAAKTSFFSARATGDALDSVCLLASLSPHKSCDTTDNPAEVLRM